MPEAKREALSEDAVRELIRQAEATRSSGAAETPLAAATRTLEAAEQWLAGAQSHGQASRMNQALTSLRESRRLILEAQRLPSEDRPEMSVRPPLTWSNASPSDCRRLTDNIRAIESARQDPNSPVAMAAFIHTLLQDETRALQDAAPLLERLARFMVDAAWAGQLRQQLLPEVDSEQGLRDRTVGAGPMALLEIILNRLSALVADPRPQGLVVYNEHLANLSLHENDLCCDRLECGLDGAETNARQNTRHSPRRFSISGGSSPIP